MLRRVLAANQLFLLNMAGAGISLLTTLILVTSWSAGSYSTYAIVASVTLLLSVPADLGQTAAAARMLLVVEDRRGAVGVALIAYGGACVVCAFLVVLLALSGLLSSPVTTTLLVVSPLAGGALGQYFIEQVCRATGDLKQLGTFNLMSRTAVLASIAVITTVPISETVQMRGAVLVGFGVPVVVVGALGVHNRASARSWGMFVPFVRQYGRTGLSLWVGRTANIVAFRSDVFILALSPRSDEAGAYVLATVLFSPTIILAQSTSAKIFKSSYRRRLIRRDMIALGAAATTLVVMNLAVGLLLVPHLASEYGVMRTVLPIVALASLVQAGYQPVNTWLLANAGGDRLRRVLLYSSVVNVAANAALIPARGAVGAAVASVVGGLLYTAMLMRLYAREVRLADI